MPSKRVSGEEPDLTEVDAGVPGDFPVPNSNGGTTVGHCSHLRSSRVGGRRLNRKDVIPMLSTRLNLVELASEHKLCAT